MFFFFFFLWLAILFTHSTIHHLHRPTLLCWYSMTPAIGGNCPPPLHNPFTYVAGYYSNSTRSFFFITKILKAYILSDMQLEKMLSFALLIINIKYLSFVCCWVISDFRSFESHITFTTLHKCDNILKSQIKYLCFFFRHMVHMWCTSEIIFHKNREPSMTPSTYLTLPIK